MVGFVFILIATRFIFRSLKNTDACTEGFTKVIDAIEKLYTNKSLKARLLEGLMQT